MEQTFFQALFLLAPTLVNAAYGPPSPEYTPSPTPSFHSPRQPVPVTSPIDLTQALDEEAPEWPGTAPFAVLRSIADEKRGYFYASRDISLGEHVGTHMDAPYHFNKNGITIGRIPVSRLIASAVVLDGDSSPNATVGLEDLRKWRLKHGPLPSHCVILFRFNWSRFYGRRDLYFGPNTNSPEFPGITEELAEHLASLDGVVGVGLDTPSIDPGQEKNMVAHRALAAGNKYILENLALSTTLPPRGWTLIAMPTRLTNGTGAPCRVVALPNGFNAASSIAMSVLLVVSLPLLGRVLVS